MEYIKNRDISILQLKDIQNELNLIENVFEKAYNLYSYNSYYDYYDELNILLYLSNNFEFTNLNHNFFKYLESNLKLFKNSLENYKKFYDKIDDKNEPLWYYLCQNKNFIKNYIYLDFKSSFGYDKPNSHGKYIDHFLIELYLENYEFKLYFFDYLHYVTNLEGFIFRPEQNFSLYSIDIFLDSSYITLKDLNLIKLYLVKKVEPLSKLKPLYNSILKIINCIYKNKQKPYYINNVKLSHTNILPNEELLKIYKEKIPFEKLSHSNKEKIYEYFESITDNSKDIIIYENLVLLQYIHPFLVDFNIYITYCNGHAWILTTLSS